MVSSTDPRVLAANKIDKYFWMITENEYDELRTITGCEVLADLNATIKDSEHVLRLAKSLGVPESNMYITHGPTIKDLKATYMSILKMSKKKTAAEEPHMIFVYIGGHGATHCEKQIFLLNSADPGSAMF